ncbi:MAG: pyruvate formate lyase family protein, partial [Candidatus Scatosoma sp.]
MGFYEEREFIKNEYQNACWDKSTGMEPIDIEKKMKEFIADKNTPEKAIQRAKLLEMLIENGQLELNPHTPFPDKINNGVRYGKAASFGIFGKICFNEYYHDFDNLAPEVRGERKLLERTGAGIPDVDFWHTVPDWETVLKLGFKGLADRVALAKEKAVAEGRFTAEREVFYESAQISLRALRLYVQRCAEYARKKGMDEYAENMEYINEHPPRTLWQAMQTARVFLTVGELGFERIRTLGAIDRLYYPYYLYDLAHGKKEEDIKELFRFFFEKISAEKRSADQPLCIGGKNEKGESFVNDLTYLILDVYDELGNHNPKIHV